MTVETINFYLALGTVGLEIVTVALIALLLLRKRFPDLDDASALVVRWGLWAGFAVTLSATVLAFYYSDVLGIAACWHCWVQRIFLSSQVVLFGVALWKHDRGIADYSIALSFFGGADALYQHYLQMGGTSSLPCPATPGALDCSVRFLFEFGHVTFPWMAFVAFSFLIVLMIFVRRGSGSSYSA